MNNIQNYFLKSYFSKYSRKILPSRHFGENYDKSPSQFLSNIKLFTEEGPEKIKEILQKNWTDENRSPQTGLLFQISTNSEIEMFWGFLNSKNKQLFISNIKYFISLFSKIKGESYQDESFLGSVIRIVDQAKDYETLTGLVQNIQSCFSQSDLTRYLMIITEITVRSQKNRPEQSKISFIYFSENILFDLMQQEHQFSSLDLSKYLYTLGLFTNYYRFDSVNYTHKSSQLVEYLLNTNLKLIRPVSIVTIYSNFFYILRFRGIKLNLSNIENLETINRVIGKWYVNQKKTETLNKMEVYEKVKPSLTLIDINMFLQSYIIENQELWRKKFTVVWEAVSVLHEFYFMSSFIEYFSSLIDNANFPSLSKFEKSLVIYMLPQVFKKHSHVPQRIKVFTNCKDLIMENISFKDISLIFEGLFPFCTILLDENNLNRKKFVLLNNLSLKNQKFFVDLINHLHKKLLSIPPKGNLETQISVFYGISQIFKLTELKELKLTKLYEDIISKIKQKVKIIYSINEILRFLSIIELWKDEEMQMLTLKIFDILERDKYSFTNKKNLENLLSLTGIKKDFEANLNQLGDKERNFFQKFLEFEKSFIGRTNLYSNKLN